MKAAFQIGDIVKLKSGGPKMTVTDVDTLIPAAKGKNEGIYKCSWFTDHNELGEGEFTESAIIRPGSAPSTVRVTGI